MAYFWDSEKRSWVMSRIRSKDTKPEIVARSILHRLGYRFTINGPLDKSLIGKPDAVLRKWKTVVLVHGCFWHAHENCKDFRIPKTRSEWWAEKLGKNKERDARVKRELREAGWKVITVWACEMKTVPKLKELVTRLGEEVGAPDKTARYKIQAETASQVAEEVQSYRVTKRISYSKS